jgi:beta-phosphoglucomutase-like phosphatase (HAD superfamily)
VTVEAIVFDMDGVLIDAREWHYEALNRALGLFGFAISRSDHLSVYDGLPTKRKLQMLSIERGLPSALHEFLNDLKQQYTIVIVTHNMQQASRVADMTAFFNVSTTDDGKRSGYLVEYDRTEAIFQNPQQQATHEYVSGRFG